MMFTSAPILALPFLAAVGSGLVLPNEAGSDARNVSSNSTITTATIGVAMLAVATKSTTTKSTTTKPTTTKPTTTKSTKIKTTKSSTTKFSTAAAAVSTTKTKTKSTKTAAIAAETSLSCPDSNGNSYKSGSSVFQIQCYYDHYGGDLSSAYAATFDDCVDLCATTSGCIDVSYGPGNPGTCWMKSSIQPTQYNTNVWGAQLVSSVSTSSTSSKAAKSTSTKASVTKSSATKSSSSKSSVTKSSTTKPAVTKSSTTKSAKTTSSKTTKTSSATITSSASSSNSSSSSSSKTSTKTTSTTSYVYPYQTTVVQKKMTSTSNKRGLAYNDPSLTYLFGGSDSQVSFAYDWSQSNCYGANPDFSCLPMLWGLTSDLTATWNATVHAAVAAGNTRVLGFNEPDYAAQSNITPKDAAKGWIQYMQPYASLVELGGPAITGQPSGLVWLQEFYGNLTHLNATAMPDFQPVHWYDEAWNVGWFKIFVQEAYAQTNTTVWITEFQGFGTDAQQAAFFEEVSPWLDASEWVGGYAYFGVFNEYLVYNNGTGNNTSGWPLLTDTGAAFDKYYNKTISQAFEEA